jgi:hypothetical protein
MCSEALVAGASVVAAIRAAQPPALDVTDAAIPDALLDAVDGLVAERIAASAAYYNAAWDRFCSAVARGPVPSGIAQALTRAIAIRAEGRRLSDAQYVAQRGDSLS